MQVAARTYRRRVVRGDDSDEAEGSADAATSSNGSSSRPPTLISAETLRRNGQASAPATGKGDGGGTGGPQEAVPAQARGQRLRKGRGSVPPAPQKKPRGTLNRLERDLREEIDAW